MTHEDDLIKKYLASKSVTKLPEAPRIPNKVLAATKFEASKIKKEFLSSKPTMIDSNFGHWHDTEDPETREFYKQVQRNSVLKKCAGCGQMVRILPHYDYCNRCADINERGGDY